MIPDIEAVLVSYLSPLIGVTVSTETPNDTSAQWVKVTQLDAQDATGNTEHLIDYMVQLDCYAGADEGSVEASGLAREVRSMLATMFQRVSDPVISRVQFLSMPRIPDTDFEPARQRYALTVSVRAHR